MPDTTTTPDAPQWAIIELMGHIRTGGTVQKDTQLGTAMLRVDVPQTDGSFVTQLVNPASIYRITFCAEPIARAAARQSAAAPMHSWELHHILPEKPAPISQHPERPQYPEPSDEEDTLY